MRTNSRVMRTTGTGAVAMALAGFLAACAGDAPGFGEEDRYRVFTPPDYADNRVYYVAAPTEEHSVLIPQEAEIAEDQKSNLVKHREPLSIIMNSVELPQDWPASISRKTIDVAVILDLATAPDGSDTSIVVWYQRGVQPGQSLNFSNLLVHFEPRWDQRTAPMFRVRVMNVTDERNAEALETLAQVRKFGGTVAALAGQPAFSPLISIATRAAGLVQANEKNSMLLDYTVQFYAGSVADDIGGAQLGALRKGSFVVLGRPVDTSRWFWRDEFKMDRRSRIVRGQNFGEVTAPLATVTVGTFESIVPKIVIERSNALTRLLQEEAAKVSLVQLEQQADALQKSISAFAKGERIYRFGVTDESDVNEVLVVINDAGTSSENRYYLIKVLNDFLQTKGYCATGKALTAYLENHGLKKGQSCGA